MKRKLIRNFAASDDGAVTVDWVVLTAAVVGLAAVAIIGIQGSASSVGDGVGDYLTSSQAGQ